MGLMKLPVLWIALAVLVLLVLAVPILGGGAIAWGIGGPGLCAPWVGA